LNGGDNQRRAKGGSYYASTISAKVDVKKGIGEGKSQGFRRLKSKVREGGREGTRGKDSDGFLSLGRNIAKGDEKLQCPPRVPCPIRAEHQGDEKGVEPNIANDGHKGGRKGEKGTFKSSRRHLRGADKKGRYKGERQNWSPQPKRKCRWRRKSYTDDTEKLRKNICFDHFVGKKVRVGNKRFPSRGNGRGGQLLAKS